MFNEDEINENKVNGRSSIGEKNSPTFSISQKFTKADYLNLVAKKASNLL